MVFADLKFLWILLPLLTLWAATRLFTYWRGQRRRSAALRFSSIKVLQRLQPSKILRLRLFVQGLRFVTLALLVIAMARPQAGRKQTEVMTEGVDIILSIDTSGSMQALDLDADRPVRKRRNRLEVVKSVVEEFVQKRPNDQIGMVVFGSEAFTQCPLTLDHGVVATFLERVEIGMAGDTTAIGAAIGTAVKRLKDSAAKSKVIVLLTDGRQTAQTLSPTKAAEIAKAFGIKIYTIGAGARGKAPFIVNHPLFGPQIEYRPEDIDESTLQEIAQITGGTYFRAEDMKGLKRVYDEIDKLEKTEITTKAYMEYDERFSWFVVPAIALLLLEVLLLGTRLRKIP
ncbi:MAG: VWA domain-containing protein [Myxococcota bacterium]